jgi:hypothetical protein
MDLPNSASLHRIVKTFAHLRASHGSVIGAPVLVQPTGEFFPDEFRPDVASVGQLLRRMMEYAPLSSELAVELAVLVPDEGHTGGCGSMACSTGPSATARRGAGGPGQAGEASVHELENGYRVTVSATDVGNPDVLSTSLARSVGALVLHEAGEVVDAGASEIASVVCGFGVLLLNGAAVWAKSCGGLRMAQATVLPVEEIAVATALFVALHGSKASQARKHLGATQREALETALDWVESNPMLVTSLRERPSRLVSGVADLEPVRGVIGQWLHKRRLEQALREAPSRTPSAMTAERKRRIEEVSALLDDVGDGELG